VPLKDFFSFSPLPAVPAMKQQERHRNYINRILWGRFPDLEPATYFSLWDSTTKYFKMPVERREFTEAPS